MNTAAAVRVACSSAWRMPARSSLRRITPSRKAPPAPTPPASVGVNTPPYRPPITKMNSTSEGQTSFIAARRSLQGFFSPAGSSLGASATMAMMVSTYMPIASRPGSTPAMKSLPMSCCVITA